ncbi:unnamed protein product [Blepharisma stoltei]|uniref:glutamate--tRNA ligase n=1 Tax=Blepharisma stoltei TaxID=1481888 RepID=A0AAU9I8S5_9CILI|nr:unnamed protein product [Blepharisma stoltei]
MRRLIGSITNMAAANNAQLYAQFHGALKGAEQGAVVTRFPPEPSGYLHIGHIKAAMLNFHYAKMYGGRMLLRFDDTNPSKENDDFVQNIIQDLEKLEIYPDAVSHTSDYFELMQVKIRELIASGHAYMDNTDVEVMRKERFDGVESKCRNQTVEENLAIFDEFVLGHRPEYCVRAKIDMQCPNKCMRDPVFYRQNDIPHLKTGSKYKVYPTYDFACPIVDSIEGVTHTLRTSEYNDRNPMFNWVIGKLNLRPVHIHDFSKLNLVNTVLSKRKLQKLVDTGVVEGWFDPRFPTVQGILRRGLQIKTLKEFMLKQGHSKNTVFMDWSDLWADNKKVIDPIAPRYTAISAETPCLINLINGPAEPYEEEHPVHDKNAELGTKRVTYSNKVLIELEDAKEINPNEKITLMKWGNVVIDSIQENQTETFRGVPLKYILEGHLVLDDKDFKKTKKLTWLSAIDDKIAPASLVEFDVLITKAKLEEDDDFDALINRNSRFETKAFASFDIKNLRPDAVIQLERRGFYRVDAQRDSSVLFFIPDGRTKSMSVLGGKVDQKLAMKGSEAAQPSKKQQQRQEKKAKQKKAEESKEESKQEKEQIPEVAKKVQESKEDQKHEEKEQAEVAKPQEEKKQE